MNFVRNLLLAVAIALPFGVPIHSSAGAEPDARNAEICGNQLQQGWSEGLRIHVAPDGAQIHLMTYTFSEGGAKRIDEKLSTSPKLFENVTGIRTGSGGIAIFGQNPIRPWLNAPSEWFQNLCAIALKGRSAFVELGLFSSRNSGSPIFTVRVPTGVGNNNGFWIGFEPPPLVPAPADSKDLLTH